MMKEILKYEAGIRKMKKFFFSLNTVLNYKEQVLESLKRRTCKSASASQDSVRVK